MVINKESYEKTIYSQKSEIKEVIENLKNYIDEDDYYNRLLIRTNSGNYYKMASYEIKDIKYLSFGMYVNKAIYISYNNINVIKATEASW